MKANYTLILFLVAAHSLLAQCPDCGNGVLDVGETASSCFTDIPQPSSCSACTAPVPFESTAGLRTTYDFIGTTTYQGTGLPTGWTFAGAASATTATTLPVADAFGAQAGLVLPTGTGIGGNRFCIGNIANLVGSGGQKLGTNYDGRANVSQNSSYVILRGGTAAAKPTLVSETFNLSAVQGFKVQIFIAASESGCGNSSWGTCTTKPRAYLDFSANGGTSWTQMLQLEVTSSATACKSQTTINNHWINEGQWNRICLTVFKTATSPGNFYPLTSASTASSGIMMDPTWFTSNFKFRIRYEGNSLCGGVSATDPGRYIAVDYPVLTSGNQMIPCGISFINMCGFGADNNDDGVGSSTATTIAASEISGINRSVNHAERGVEIFTYQNSSFVPTNTTAATLPSSQNLCDAEGHDKQCIATAANSFVVYECITDYDPSVNPLYRIRVNYYKNSVAQSLTLSQVSAVGKTPSIGWRHTGSVFYNCAGSGDLRPVCNAYLFSGETPFNMPRTFYQLNTDALGRSQSYYGATSCSNYFNGPFLSPVLEPLLTGTLNSGLICNGSDLNFSAQVKTCNGTGSNGEITVYGPGSSSTVFETFSAGTGTTPITVAGDYILKATSSAGCLDCSRSVCLTVTAADISDCVAIPLATGFNFKVSRRNGINELEWSTGQQPEKFVVERSADGEHFTALAELSGMNNDEFVYRYSDVASNETALYYRLLQRGIDGKSSRSNVIAVLPGANANLLHAYYSASQQQLGVHCKGENIPVDLQVINSTGQQVLFTHVVVTNFLEVPADLDNGIYVVRLFSPAGNFSSRFAVSK